MTLKETYEKLRLEAVALRRENAKLKVGTYVDADRAANENEIRHLKWENMNLRRDAERYHSYWRAAVARPSGPSAEDLIRIEDLAALNRNLSSENSSLKNQLQESLDIISRLKAQMNRDHENSSIPSSKERFPKKIKNNRVKTERKPGGQPGHAGHRRPHMEPTAPLVDIPVPDSILNSPDYYLTGKIISKQVVDLNISVSVTEYSTPEYRSRSTGERGHAAFPDGIINESGYGENAKALAFLLNNYCNVSIDKTGELIKGLSNGSIALSKGMISGLTSVFSDKTVNERQKIYDRLLLAPAMYSDATPGRVNGKTVQVIICANEDELMYFFREHKGFEGIKGTPVEQYQQLLVHDHDKTYYHYGAGHQECLAHVLRYLQDSIDNEPAFTWNHDMKSFLSALIHNTKDRRSSLSEEEISGFEADFDAILKTGESEYLLHPPNRYYPDGFNLHKKLMNYKENHLLFLHHPEIDYTNNISERGLRKFKRKQRQAVAFRSNKSVELLCDCMSIIESNRIYDANIFQLSKNVFSNV